MQSGVITAVAIDHLLYDIITRHHCSLITEIYWTGLIFSLLILNRVSNLNAITCTISEICITVIYQFSMENVLHVVGSGGGGTSILSNTFSMENGCTSLVHIPKTDQPVAINLETLFL